MMTVSREPIILGGGGGGADHAGSIYKYLSVILGHENLTIIIC